jgi:hypothetical protein
MASSFAKPLGMGLSQQGAFDQAQLGRPLFRGALPGGGG